MAARRTLNSLRFICLPRGLVKREDCIEAAHVRAEVVVVDQAHSISLPVDDVNDIVLVWADSDPVLELCPAGSFEGANGY